MWHLSRSPGSLGQPPSGIPGGLNGVYTSLLTVEMSSRLQESEIGLQGSPGETCPSSLSPHFSLPGALGTLSLPHPFPSPHVCPHCQALVLHLDNPKTSQWISQALPPYPHRASHWPLLPQDSSVAPHHFQDQT